jgi:hypothetical protein
MGEAIVGAVIGAFVGSVLGYVFAYYLAQQTRRQELEERKGRLLRALSHELQVQAPPITDDLESEHVTIWSGFQLASLEPLVDLAANDPDEELLQSLAALQASVTNFNDTIASTNALEIQGAGSDPELLRQNLRDARKYAQGVYDEAQSDANRVLEAIARRRRRLPFS